ncbi:MAG: ATP phosphoribosyltransferase [Gammaproteobacteria bacterium]|nr:ATP phosphoribosyltransferase [Gammaproteobacteria bacterium]
MMQKLTLALTKGRLLTPALSLLASVNIQPLESLTQSRKLVFPTSQDNLQLMVLRGTDVVTYVEQGIADMGISGKDVLMEYGEDGFYEPLDLGIGACRMMVAGLSEEPPLPSRMKVATKFVNIAKKYYASQGAQVDIIKLYGGMELAPLTGLAHRIVDIVDTGNTLKANGLVPMDLIAPITSRLVVNKISMKMKFNEINPLINKLKEVLDDPSADPS